MIKAVFDTLGGPILIGIFFVLFLLESKFPLRRRVQSKRIRIIINIIFSIPAFVLLRILFIPAMVWLATQNEFWHVGLNYLLHIPVWLKGVLTFILLDYSNFVWHILLHKLPILWRFHVVHHTDRDLDICTAFRFHFGEMIGSVLFRGGAIMLIGASPIMVLMYEIAYEAATQFHHSNLKIPFQLEKMLNYFIVTPRMHGIHHSIIRKETDSNYSIIFSFWDRIHKTVRLNIHQKEIIIGVPGHVDESDLTIGDLLMMPFKKISPGKNIERRVDEKDFNIMKE